MSNSGVIRPGDVQKMSAGTGVQHSEFNGSRTEPVHFLQIWIVPEVRGIAPSYEQKTFPPDAQRGKLRLIGSRDGRDGSVTIRQDVDAYASVLEEGQEARHVLAPGRHAWLHVAEGELTVNGNRLEEGDAIAATGESQLDIVGLGAEFLLFDLG
jgi:redox-sensitive bicupin YhaK (pirin superfamily)